MGTLVSEEDIGLFHSVAQEVQRLAGIEIEFFQFSVTSMKNPDGSSGYDPLYGEKQCQSSTGMAGQNGVSSQSELGRAYRLMGIFEHDEAQSSATEGGQVTDSATTLFFARRDFDILNIGPPKTGDVVRYRDIYWNVNNVINDGWIDMSHVNFSLYKMAIVYNSKLSAEKKVEG